ncbi:MAG: matrixin family metalloprotease [Clostridia bacterium]|nr:matrixin family metalloprotease [Clostridia bacterium]
MKKLLYKTRMFLAVTMVLVVILTSCVGLVSAAGFKDGIGCVTCSNEIAPSYSELYAAVHAAVMDWDWHLAILNEQYGVDWNMTDTVEDQTDSMIRFLAMNNQEAEQYSDDLFENAHTIVSDQLIAMMFCFSSNTLVSSDSSTWDRVEMIFLVDNLEKQDYLHDYFDLKQIVNHEIGHALGLADRTDDQGVIMYYNKETCTAEVATASDLQNVYFLYSNVG